MNEILFRFLTFIAGRRRRWWPCSCPTSCSVGISGIRHQVGAGGGGAYAGGLVGGEKTRGGGGLTDRHCAAPARDVATAVVTATPASGSRTRCPAAPAFPLQDYDGETDGVGHLRRRYAEERSARSDICFVFLFVCFLGGGVLLLLFFSYYCLLV